MMSWETSILRKMDRRLIAISLLTRDKLNPLLFRIRPKIKLNKIFLGQDSRNLRPIFCKLINFWTNLSMSKYNLKNSWMTMIRTHNLLRTSLHLIWNWSRITAKRLAKLMNIKSIRKNLNNSNRPQGLAKKRRKEKRASRTRLSKKS
jgi:hypothetical protein